MVADREASNASHLQRSRADAKRAMQGVAYLLALWAGIGILVVTSVVQRRVPTVSLYLDPAATSSARVWTGFFTELGLMLWAVAATAAGFLWAVCARGGWDRSGARLGGSAAGFTALLWLDDQFAVRNWALPHVLGAPESAGDVIYLSLGVAWVALNWRTIVVSDRLIVMAAGLGLGSSELVNFGIKEQFTTTGTLLEEVPKLLGIAAWALFFVMRFRRELDGVMQRASIAEESPR